MSTTAKIDQAIVDLLDELMTKDRDATEGYIKASQNVKNLEMRGMLMRFSQLRGRFVKGLKHEIENLGGSFKDSSSIQSTLHRFWMDIMGTITGKDEDVILQECLRGERASLNDYEEAEQNTFLPDTTKKLIEAHRREIENTIDELEKRINQNPTDSGNGQGIVNAFANLIK